ncbi:MAG: hypothetical protein JKY70_01260 [Mucilaginibacter sp.]|nr:hypothetical protein [Mucilaginibacter sp.]
MVLDSDMLFFKYPDELITWLQNPKHAFALKDPLDSYHYSMGLMEKLTKQPVTKYINVGAIGLNSPDIDWDAVERWIIELETTEGSSYLLEQALSAMIISGNKLQTPNPENYLVMPDKEQVIVQQGILHHYVDRSKQWYYKIAWRTVK